MAEVGRYPFVVYGLLTQYDAVSPSLTVTEAATSLAMFFVADVFLVSTMIYISHRTVTRGLPEIDGNSLEEHQFRIHLPRRRSVMPSLSNLQVIFLGIIATELMLFCT